VVEWVWRQPLQVLVWVLRPAVAGEPAWEPLREGEEGPAPEPEVSPGPPDGRLEATQSP